MCYNASQHTDGTPRLLALVRFIFLRHAMPGFDFDQLDYYALLGVPHTASPDEIKRAYRQQINRYHPDRYVSAAASEQQYAALRARRINEAYQVLGNAESRSAYNQNQLGLTATAVAHPPPEAWAMPRAPEPSITFPIHRDHQHELYRQARQQLDNGQYLETIVTLRQLHQLNPFYRDTAAMLAQAEAALQQAPKASAAQAPKRKKLPAMLYMRAAGGVAAVGLVLAIAWFGQPFFTGRNAVANAPELPLVQAPAAVEPTTAPPTAAIPTVLQATAVPPTAIPATAVPTAVPPTAVPPTAVPTAVPPTPVPTAPPAPTAVPVPAVVPLEQGTLLLADDFASGVGWPTVSGDGWSVGYAPGGYQITAEPGRGDIWGFSTAPTANFSVGVNVQMQGGSAGLMLRYLNDDNYTTFMISPANGSYRVERMLGGQPVLLAAGASPAIVPGGNNRLVAELRGDEVRLFVNGQALTTLVPTGLGGSRQYGMVANDQGLSTVALFTNLAVRAVE
ncbi:MAG: J domain-containing protein [Chloroflexaceae bacterium]|nr:J domain-containing protein [Chloroflexaceae bacterium]